jgi:hypothetical protein
MSVPIVEVGLYPIIINDCTNAWDQYLKGSLFKFLTVGKGIPELRIK